MDTYRRQSEISRELLARGLFMEYGVEHDEIIRNSFGKPSLRNHRDIHFSISHCSGAVVVCLSDYRVGIDIERVRRFDPLVANRILNEEEILNLSLQADQDLYFTRIWTLKESYVKAIGCGLSYPLKKLHILMDEKEISSNRPAAEFCLLNHCEGFIISQCTIHEKTL